VSESAHVRPGCYNSRPTVLHCIDLHVYRKLFNWENNVFQEQPMYLSDICIYLTDCLSLDPQQIIVHRTMKLKLAISQEKNFFGKVIFDSCASVEVFLGGSKIVLIVSIKCWYFYQILRKFRGEQMLHPCSPSGCPCFDLND